MECECLLELTSSASNSLRSSPSVLVVDQSVEVADFLPFVRQIACENPATSVVATGSQITVPLAVELLHHGVEWVFCKDLRMEEVVTAMPNIIQKAKIGHEELTDHEQLIQLFAGISVRELSVLKMVLRGIPNKLIATHLNVSIRTVEARRAKVYRKLNADTLSDLVRRVDRAIALQDRFGPFGVEPLTLHVDESISLKIESTLASECMVLEPKLRLA